MRTISRLTVGLAMLTVCFALEAQSHPAMGVSLTCALRAGGPSDIVARVLTQKLITT